MRKDKKEELMKTCGVLVSQATYGRSAILKFSLRRDSFAKRLHDMRPKRRTCLINWLLLPEGFSLLMKVPDAEQLSKTLHWLKSTTTSDYSRRSNEEGPFWNGRYDATLVQRGCHLMRCSLAMDQRITKETTSLHPQEWKHSGSLELCGIRKRYRINQPKPAFRHMGDHDVEAMRNAYITASKRDYSSPVKALAIGSKTFIEKLATAVDASRRNVSTSSLWARDSFGEQTFALYASVAHHNSFVRSLKW